MFAKWLFWGMVWFFNPCIASVESLRQLYYLNSTAIRDSWVYSDDMEEHREKFVEWVLAHDLSEVYSRVLLTLGCRDADAIPKVANAGKTAHENGIDYQVMHNGIKIIKDSYYGSWMSDLIYGLRGHHEPQEEKVFYEVLKEIEPGAVMIELGSYWAYYSLWFSKAILNGKNYLVEPDVENLAIGQANFSLNGASGFFFHGSIGTYPHGNSRAPVPISIDPFLIENGIERVHLLHPDIQGAECLMLESATHSLKEQKIDYLFISTHSDSLHANCMRTLVENNYEVIAEHTPAQSFSVDGLIVAKRRGLSGKRDVSISKR